MNDGKLLKAVHRRFDEWRRQRAVAKKRDRLDRKQKATEWELFLDRAKFEGYDIENNETHRLIVLAAWLKKLGEEVELPEGDGMEEDHRDLTF
jgi:hypothetical protein